MPGISIHVVDVSRGVVAERMQVELFSLGPERRLVASGALSGSGLLVHPTLDKRFERGVYEAVFHVADWYRMLDTALPVVPFLDIVIYRFGVDNADQHYHLPFKCTPWGYSCFRGGK